MDLKPVVFGIVIFLVFWAFQTGYFHSLGTSAWLAAVVIFSVLMILLGKLSMKKAPADIMTLWNFAIGFAVVSTFIFSFTMPYIGFATPVGYDMSALTPVVVSLWFVVFGAAHLAAGWQSKMSLAILIGLIWVFSAVPVLAIGSNSYVYFGWITGLSFVLVGLLKKR